MMIWDPTAKFNSRQYFRQYCMPVIRPWHIIPKNWATYNMLCSYALWITLLCFPVLVITLALCSCTCKLTSDIVVWSTLWANVQIVGISIVHFKIRLKLKLCLILTIILNRILHVINFCTIMILRNHYMPYCICSIIYVCSTWIGELLCSKL